jgi:hypothetical protein
LVTNPDAEPVEPTAPERAEAGLRYVIAGHPAGAIRRILLYLVAAVALFMLGASTPLGIIGGGLGLIALLLLAMSDQLS